MKLIQLKTASRLLCSLVAGAALFTSCIADHFDDQPGGITSGKQSDITITLNMPNSAPKTYAISEQDENFVQTIDVLSFKADASKASGWRFEYSARGRSIKDVDADNATRSKKTFTVTLSKDETNEQKLVVLANVRGLLEKLENEGMVAGADMDALLARFVFENAGSWNANNDNTKQEGDADRFKPFPMWGRIQNALIIGENTTSASIGTISLVRNIARLDVILADTVVKTGTFKLDKVYIYNSKSKGYVVPATANLDNNTKVKAATVPTGATDYAAWNNDEKLFYTVPTAMQNAFERTMYVFEAASVAKNKSSDATCVVVGGRYNGSENTTYYRLDFFEEDGETFRDILRNHHYRMKILSVSGPGYDTEDEAFNSKSLNMKVEIEGWDDGEFNDVYFNGQYMLAVRPGSLVEFQKNQDTKTIEIMTNYDAKDNEGWKIVAITEADGKTENTGWLTTDKTKGQLYGANKKYVETKISVSENETGETREGYIFVKAGNLEAKIHVTQGTKPNVSITIVGADGKPITDLIFNSGKDATPDPKNFKVIFTPKNAEVTINNMQMGDDMFTGTGIQSGTSYGSNVNGELSYTAAPPAIAESETTGKPFLEKKAMLTFTVSAGGITQTKTLNLKHAIYNIVPEIDNIYLMDGLQHTLNIKANCSWKVEYLESNGEPIDDPKKVIKIFNTQSGGFEYKNGEKVRFTTYDDIYGSNGEPSKFTGTAKIRFSSPDGHFETFTRDLFAVSGVPQDYMEANCYILDPVAGAGILIPVRAANGVFYQDKNDPSKKLVVPAAFANAVGNGGIQIAADASFGAKLVWTDAPGTDNKGIADDAALSLVMPIGIGPDGYILVMPGKSKKEGNAVVAVTKKVGDTEEVLWSWHIWVTDQTTSSPISVKAGILMDRHIGALNGYTSDPHTGGTDYSKTGLLFQWGRKDPSLTGKTNGSNTPTVYDGDGKTVVMIHANYHSQGSIINGIRFPEHFYSAGQSPYCWHGTTVDNDLWSPSTKTIFDPSPWGWRVPPAFVTAWSAVTQGKVQTGRMWDAIGYYPYSSTRGSTGVLGSVGGNGSSWTATPEVTYPYRAIQMFIDTGGSAPAQQTQARVNGNTVRCVKDE